jgi:hypothetical protein
VGRDRLKRLLGADDSLDVFGVHGVGGIARRDPDRRVRRALGSAAPGIWDYVTETGAGRITTMASPGLDPDPRACW